MGGFRYFLLSIQATLLCALILSPGIALAELKVLTSEDPPANYFHEGEISGTSVEIAQELLTRIGSQAKVQIVPWARAFDSILHQNNVMIITAGQTPNRKGLGLHFIGPILTRHHAIYKRKDCETQVDSIDDIKRQKLIVGGLREDWRSRHLSECGVPMDLSNVLTNNLQKLQNDRFMLIVGSDVETPAQLSISKLPADHLEIAVSIKEAGSYFMFSKDINPTTLAKAKQAFLEMQKTDFFDKLAAKYSKRFGYQLSYSPDKGIYRSLPTN